MNFSKYEGKGIQVKDLMAMCETLPFFADCRVVLVENSGFFASAQEELAAYISTIPQTTHLIFAESEVDKRGRLYKAVSANGYCANMTRPDERTLTQWIGVSLQKEGRGISSRTASHLLSLVDNDMDNLRQELEKLICYTADKKEVTIEDVDAVCVVHTENKIFDMINAIGAKNQTRALKLYDDLLTLREPAMRILYLIARQFNQLYEIKDLMVKGCNANLIEERTGIKSFIVKRSMGLCQNFSLQELRNALEDSVDYEEAVKTGRLSDHLAVELLINKYSQNE